MRSYLWGLLESSQVITLFGPLLGCDDCVWNLCQVLVDTVNPVCIILPPTSTSYWHNSQRSLVGSKGKQARTVLFESNMASTGTIAGTRLSSCVWVGVKGNPGSSLACLLQVVGTCLYHVFIMWIGLSLNSWCHGRRFTGFAEAVAWVFPSGSNCDAKRDGKGHNVQNYDTPISSLHCFLCFQYVPSLALSLTNTDLNLLCFCLMGREQSWFWLPDRTQCLKFPVIRSRPRQSGWIPWCKPWTNTTRDSRGCMGNRISIGKVRCQANGLNSMIIFQ
jgi:hypothetical protein